MHYQDYKRRRRSRIVTLLLAVAIGMPLFPSFSGISADENENAAGISAEENVKATASSSETKRFFRTNGLKDPVIPSSETDPWRGNYVYFGRYDGKPIKFRVLDTHATEYGADTILLDSDKVLYIDAFDEDGVPNSESGTANQWLISDCRRNLNGYSFLRKAGGFSSIEKSIILNSSRAEAYYKFGDGPGEVPLFVLSFFSYSAALDKEKFFLLDVGDLSNLAYGYSQVTDNETDCANRLKYDLTGKASPWRLRTATTRIANSTSMNAYIYGTGELHIGCEAVERAGIAPACNILKDKILMSTVVAGNPTTVGTEYSLTLLDDNIKIKVDDSKKAVLRGSKVTVPYTLSGSDSGNVNQVSVLILKERYDPDAETNEILYYETLSTDSSGSSYFNMPSDMTLTFWSTRYHVYLVAEHTNGTYGTVYAGISNEITRPIAHAELDFVSNKEVHLSNVQRDALNYLIDEDLIDRRKSSNPDVQYVYDIDKDGNYDFQLLYGKYWEKLPSNSVVGDLCFTEEQLTGSDYSSIRFMMSRPDVVLDLSGGTTYVGSIEADALIYLMTKKIIGFKFIDHNTYSAYLDIDKDGSYDLVVPKTDANPMILYSGRSLSGIYSIPKTQLADSIYSSVTFKFPKATPTPSPTVAKPAQPLNVKTTTESPTSVKVSWSAVSGASGYQVARSTSPDKDFVALGTVTETSRVCPGLTCGTTYYFKVRAYKNVNGSKVYGDYSAVASVVTVTKPSAPPGVKATSTSTSSIKVSWSAVSGASGYQVARSTSPDKDFVVLGSVTELYRSCTGLTCGTKYYFKVRAYKIVDGKRVYGAYSAVVNAIPKPSAPTGVKATVSSSTSVTVSWNKVTGATGYEVWRATSADGTYSKTGAVTECSRRCPGLTSGKKYYFKVRAYKEVNGTKIYSAYSTVVSATPK